MMHASSRGAVAALLRRGIASGACRSHPGVPGAVASTCTAAYHSGSGASCSAASQGGVGVGRWAVQACSPTAASATVLDSSQSGTGAAAHQARLVHEGRCFVTMPMTDAPGAVAMFQPGGAWDWRAPQLVASREAAVASAIICGGMEGLLAKIDLDGEVEWEEMQAGSVMKKRKKAMNKHKWKKRRKRDRSYDR